MPTNNSINTTGPGVVQVVTSTYATFSALSTVFPVCDAGIFTSNDSVPQNTAGTEIVTVTITPKFANSNLVIEYFGNGNLNLTYTCYVCTALFVDSTANALAANVAVTEYQNNIVLLYNEISGSTSSRTYKIRVGPTRAGQTTSVNGTAGARYLGGIQTCRLTVTEVI